MKIKNMSKRAISVFLSLMMCVSLLQVPAFAATEPQYDEFGNLITTESAAPVESETPVVTEPVVPETPVVPEDDAVIDNNTDVDVETDADTEDDADANADADVEGDADANADADAEDEADANADANAEDNADANADADAEDEANTESDADAENDVDVENIEDTEVPSNSKLPNAEENIALAQEIVDDTIGNVITVDDSDDFNIDYSNTDNTITFKLAANVVSPSIAFKHSANIIIDLCGHTLSSNGQSASGEKKNFISVENGSLTVTDSSETGTGTIVGDNSDNVINVEAKGSLTIENGTIEATNGTERGIFTRGKVAMTGGTITGGNTSGNGGAVHVFGGEFTMSGGSITENHSKAGGGVYVNNNGNFTMSGGTIDNNSAKNGGGVYVNGGKFTMDNGTISNNTVADAKEKKLSDYDSIYSSGGGVYVNGGEFTMNSGTISGNVAKENAESDNDHATSYLNGNRGGGVYVAKDDKTSDKKKGTFTMNGGTIEQNKAGEGGGVFIEYAPMNVWSDGNGGPTHMNQFSMNGGTVDSNTAFIGEGGGIYIRGIGEIIKGRITNNETHTGSDLGGGGIYVESDGRLNIVNAAIYENMAKGLGGGLAACVHGFTSAVRLDGAAIWGNTSEGDKNAVTKSEKIDGSNLWKDKSEFKNAAQDIFTASDKAQDDKDAGAVIGNMMVGGGQANWTGWNVNNNGKDADGSPAYTWTEVTSENNAYVESDRLLALTSHASEEAQDAAEAAADVIISGNKSLYTHGGGIANNGVLTFGLQNEENQFGQLPTLTVQKTVEGDNNALTGWDFSFGMKDENGENVDTGNATNTNPKTTLEFDLNNFDVSNFGNGDTATYTFYVTENENGQLEEVTNGGTMAYDKSQYKITVTVTKKVVEDKDGANQYTFTSYSFSDPVIVKTHDAEGNEIADGLEVNGDMQFVNKYEKPEEPILPTPLVAYDPLELTIKKVFSVVGGEAPTEGEFNFKAEGEEFNANASISLKELHENDNTADTTLTAGVKFDDDGKMMGYDFTVSELDEEMANVTYSKHSYHVSLKVDQKSDDDGITHYFYVPTITHYDENGNVVNDDVATDIANNILTFTNVFKPTTPPTDTDSENPGPDPDPEEPTTPPTTPDRPSRPTPPPTPEEPTIDIPDDDVPLAPAPEEPEVSIPDEDVPLAGEPPLVELPEPEVPLAPMPPETTTIPDPEVPLAGVPQTGDNAGGFYALMALAACGLVVLNLRKKENEI